MNNNFGLGSRCMKKAACFALRLSVSRGSLSFLSAALLLQRWSLFVDWLYENTSVRKMEDISFGIVLEYGEDLAFAAIEEELSAAAAQNYLSAVNSVLHRATRGRWESVSPTKDCNILKRSYVRTTVPASFNRKKYREALDSIRKLLGERAVAIVELCRELGLRSKEASLFDAAGLLLQAKSCGEVTIISGTKGGRGRLLRKLSATQIEVLENASKVQGDDFSLIPSSQTWKSWREGDLRKIRESVQELMLASGLHDLRAGFACEYYSVISGNEPPLLSSAEVDLEIDRSARMVVAKVLGHNRPNILTSYIGGKRHEVK